MARCCECGDPDAHTMIDDDWYCEACLSGLDDEEMDEPSDYGEVDWCWGCGRYIGDQRGEYCDRCPALLFPE